METNSEAAALRAERLFSSLAGRIAGIACGLACGLFSGGTSPRLGSGDLFLLSARRLVSGPAPRLGLLRRSAFGGTGLARIGDRLQRGLPFGPGRITRRG